MGSIDWREAGPQKARLDSQPCTPGSWAQEAGGDLPGGAERGEPFWGLQHTPSSHTAYGIAARDRDTDTEEMVPQVQEQGLGLHGALKLRLQPPGLV